MPTDVPAGTPPEGGAPEPADDDPLVFAAHDLGRDRALPARRTDEDAPFTTAPRPGELARPTPALEPTAAAPPTAAPPVAAPPPGGTPAAHGFLIRDLVDTAAPRAPVDALVVSDSPAPTPGAIVPKAGFKIHSSPATPLTGGADAPLPWTVRHPGAKPAGSPGGWTARQGVQAERSAKETMRRLREDAVHVSWEAAWTAVKSADRRLFKRRER
ncbi:MAG: hypothetical protein ABI352_00670 [Candidatus Dormibacter sp.]